MPFAYSISGVFDFMPLLKVSQNADLRLDEKSAKDVSPLTWTLPPQRSLEQFERAWPFGWVRRTNPTWR